MSIISLSSLLVYLQYIFGMLTPAATGLVVFPLVSSLLLIFFRERARFSIGFVISCVLLFIVFIIAFMQSSMASYPQYKFMFTLVKWISYLTIGYYVYLNSHDYFKISFLLLLIFTCFCMFSMIFGSYEVDLNNRLFVGVYNPIWIGRAIYEMLLVATIALSIKKKYMLVLFFLCLYISYASGSKSSILSFLIVAFAYFNSRNQVSKLKKFSLLSVFLVLCFGIAYYFKDDVYFQSRFLSLVPENSSVEIYNSSRVVVWPNTISLFLSQDIYPLLFGNGLGEFPKFYLGVEPTFKYYPHNAILEFLVEFGVLFTFAFIAYVAYFYFKSDDPIKYLLLYYVICSMFSGDLLLNEFVFLYLGMVIRSVEYNS